MPVIRNPSGKRIPPSNEELNALFGQRNRKEFLPCKRNGCVDGWVPLPHRPDEKYVKVRRCQCFEIYKEKTA